jgi:hypothetical protein
MALAKNITVTVTIIPIIIMLLIGTSVEATSIDTSHKLPRSARDYIEKNYNGYSVMRVSDDPLCGGGNSLDVLLKKSGADNISVIFDERGTFLQREWEMTYVALPPEVKEAVAKHFTDFTPATDAERLVLSNGTTQYQVDVMKGNIGSEVLLSRTGNIICSRKETPRINRGTAYQGEKDDSREIGEDGAVQKRKTLQKKLISLLTQLITLLTSVSK